MGIIGDMPSGEEIGGWGSRRSHRKNIRSVGPKSCAAVTKCQGRCEDSDPDDRGGSFFRSILFNKSSLRMASQASTESLTCSSASSTGSWAIGLTGPVGDAEVRPRRKSVGFNNTDRIILIPGREEYDEETKGQIWYSTSEYSGFQEATSQFFQERGCVFRLDAGVTELLE